jgi:hypothetical protein
MRWSDLPLSPSDRTLRQFAGLWIVFFGGLACWHGLFRGHEIASIVLAILAITFGPLGLVKPRALKPIFVAWMVVAFPIGWVVSHVLLGCLYYGVFTPVGFFFRLAGRDPLELKRPAGKSTYWVTKPAATDVRRYFKQF